jgi:AbrB family looped-hinge helix DNA binding protein
MKQYQVTRKLQITIPKPIAKELHIKPGDAVVFERTGRAVLVKKAASRVGDLKEMVDAVEAFAQDMRRVGRYVRAAERSLDENLSRHIRS